MNINFKLSDSQKHDILFNLLNPNFNEEGSLTVDCVVCDVYEEYALVVNYADASYERVYYSKNDAEDKIEITKRERCYIVDVNTEEKEALDALANGGTYAQAVENHTAQAVTINEQATTISEQAETIASLNTTVENLTADNQNYSTKVGELEENISTLSTERDNAQTELHSVNEQLTEANNNLTAAISDKVDLQGKFDNLTSEYAALQAERDNLAEFKKDVVDTEKRNIINCYTETLGAEIIDTYTKNMDNYSAEELDMRLTYECKKINPTIFSKIPNDPQPQYVPKPDPAGRGINDILAHYENK